MTASGGYHAVRNPLPLPTADHGMADGEYRKRKRLGLLDCVCPWGYRSLGLLYGTSFGKDWVRLSTAANCRHHGWTENDR